MGIIQRKHQFGTIEDFQPDDTETEMYILTDGSGVSMESLLDRVREKWGADTQLSDIQIRSEFIHTRCLGYDSFDRGDWDNYLVITKD